MNRGSTSDRAREELERYSENLKTLFGENYAENSRFHAAVAEVEKGRAAWLVLADLEDDTKPAAKGESAAGAGDGFGWAW